MTINALLLSLLIMLPLIVMRVVVVVVMMIIGDNADDYVRELDKNSHGKNL